jgi:pyruvate formate lyase activating enzyme
MDDALHRRATGVSNRLILENVCRLAQSSVPIIVRIPLVPGYNANAHNLKATAAFISRLDVQEVHLLPLHQLGRAKYKRLCRAYEHDMVSGQGQVDPGDEDCCDHLRAKEILEQFGLCVQVGG